MTSITPVEHRRAGEIAGPGVRITKAAPSVVAQALFNGAVAVGDGGPAAEIVLQDVMDRVCVVFSHYHGIYPSWTGKASQPFLRGGVPAGFRHILTVAHIALGADVGADVLFHEDALVVVAVSVVQAFVALHDLAHLVETRVGDALLLRGEHAREGLGRIHGVWLGGGAIHGVGEHSLSGGGLGRHAAVAVIGRCAGLHRAEPHLRQTVLEVVCEGLFQVGPVVFSAG